MIHQFDGMDTIKISILDNELTVVSDTIPGVYTACLGVWVAVGSRHERQKEHGLSHLIEHMAFKGTKRRSALQIAADIENVGGDINAATSTEYTSYAARVLGEDVPLALDVLSDILIHSEFSEDELIKEKNVIYQEYAAVEDTPDDLITDVFLETAFPNQPLGRPILGTPGTLKPMDGDLIRSFLKREYIPSRIVLAASGAVRHEQLVELAQKYFGSLERREAPPYPKAIYQGGERRISRKLEQVNAIIGFPGNSYKSPEAYATQIFSQVLGGSLTSRLWREIREKRGLAYSIDSFHWGFSDTGLFGLSAGTSEKDLSELLKVSLETAYETTQDLSESELSRAKAQAKVGILASMETPGGRVERLARQILAWQRLIPAHELVAKIDALTIEEVKSVGLDVLKGKPTLSLIGSFPKLEPYDTIFKNLL